MSHESEPQGTRSSSFARALDRHFLACAAAATGTMLTAGVDVAEGGVVYSGLLDLAVPNSFTGIYIDVDGNVTGADNVALPGWDINIYNANFQSGTKAVNVIFPDDHPSPDPLRPGTPIGVAGNVTYVSKLGAGVTIGAGAGFLETPNANYPQAYFAYHNAGGYDDSLWNGGVTDGFMGFRFTVDGSIHYGWARLNIESFNDGYDVTLRDFAYNDVAGESILTGQVPEPATGLALAVLALGAAGVRPSRKQRATG